MRRKTILGGGCAAALMLLGGCAGGPLGPSEVPVNASGPEPVLAIDGLPSTQRLRVGESVLVSISLAPASSSVHWTSGGSGGATLEPTPLQSPCGAGCAWVSGARPGVVHLRATFALPDGSHAEVASARVCGAPSASECRLVPAEILVW